MYKDGKRTCTESVRLIKPFVWSPSRWRGLRGLLKLLNRSQRTSECDGNISNNIYGLLTKLIGQDGWILAKFERTNEANIQPSGPKKFGQ